MGTIGRPLRWAWHGLREVVYQIRHGQDDMQEMYGNPADKLSAEERMLQGSVTLSLSNLGSGGMP